MRALACCGGSVTGEPVVLVADDSDVVVCKTLATGGDGVLARTAQGAAEDHDDLSTVALSRSEEGQSKERSSSDAATALVFSSCTTATGSAKTSMGETTGDMADLDDLTTVTVSSPSRAHIREHTLAQYSSHHTTSSYGTSPQSPTSILTLVRQNSRKSLGRVEAACQPEAEEVANLEGLMQRKPEEVSMLLADQGLMRGVPYGVLVGGLGSIFRSSSTGIAGGASTASYDMSSAMQPGQTFRGFISHSWQASSYFKAVTLLNKQLFRPVPLLWLTLAVFHIAAGCTMALAVESHLRSCTATWLGSCRDAEPDDSEANTRHLFVVGMVQLTGITAVVVLFVSSLALGPYWLAPRKNRYFLDKCSINQDDHEMKQMGIGHLCEFVQAADEMVVLADRTYLHRLWCVCELALFAKVSPDLGHLDWRFLWAAPAAHSLALLGAILWYVAVIPRLFDLSGGELLISLVTLELCAGLLFASCAFSLCWWLRATRQALRDLEAFSIRSAECFLADDRVLVCHFVATAWAVSKPSGDDGEVAYDGGLEAFDEFVRGKLRDSVARRNFRMKPALCTLFGPMVMLHVWLALVALVPDLLSSCLL